VLVDGHDPLDWACAVDALLAAPEYRAALSAGAVEHAAGFSWDRTAEGLLRVYREAVAQHRAMIAARVGAYTW
jgi:D-inositol-3-phosphate glycosyltransferase